MGFLHFVTLVLAVLRFILFLQDKKQGFVIWGYSNLVQISCFEICILLHFATIRGFRIRVSSIFRLSSFSPFLYLFFLATDTVSFDFVIQFDYRKGQSRLHALFDPVHGAQKLQQPPISGQPSISLQISQKKKLIFLKKISQHIFFRSTLHFIIFFLVFLFELQTLYLMLRQSS